MPSILVAVRSSIARPSRRMPLRPCSGVRSTRTRPWPTVRRPRPSRSATTSYPVDRAPLQVEGSIHHKFNTDQIALRTIERVDGDLLDTDSIRYLVNAAV